MNRDMVRDMDMVKEVLAISTMSRKKTISY